jgi:hypothetical protein
MKFWIPEQLAAHLKGEVIVEHGPVHKGWLPKREAPLVFRGRVFRSAPSSSLVSAGGSLFCLPQRHEVGSEVHVTITQAAPALQKK